MFYVSLQSSEMQRALETLAGLYFPFLILLVTVAFARSKKYEIIQDNFCYVLGDTFLVLIGSVNYSAFNSHLLAFFKKSVSKFGETIPCNYVMPGCFSYFLSFRILVTVISCNCEMGYFFSAFNGFCFRITDRDDRSDVLCFLVNS